MRKFYFLRTATKFWLGRGIISLSSWMNKQLMSLDTEINTAQTLVSELSAFEFEISVEN